MPEKLIRLSKSCLSSAEKQAVMEVLDSEFLAWGGGSAVRAGPNHILWSADDLRGKRYGAVHLAFRPAESAQVMRCWCHH